MDFMHIHQCSASPMSMYTTKDSRFSAGHIFASKILSMFFSHWSAASGLVLPPNFVGWCFRKSSKLHSLTVGRGSGPNTGAPALFSSSWRRTSICCRWVSSAATLVASICCITSCYCSSDAVYRYIDASCCCIILVLCCVIAATIASIALAISGALPWEDVYKGSQCLTQAPPWALNVFIRIWRGVYKGSQWSLKTRLLSRCNMNQAPK